MKIIKRNGSEEVFDINKIIKAVKKADINSEERSLSDGQIEDIAEYVEFKCNKLNRAVSVEEIQDMVENQIMATGAFELAKSYVRYRYCTVQLIAFKFNIHGNILDLTIT